MSRLPGMGIGDLEGSSGTRAPINTGLPLLGVPEQPRLLAPGVVPNVPGSQGVQLLDGLLRTLRGTGDAIGELGQRAAVRAARIEQSMADTLREEERLSAALDSQDKGQATLDFRRELPQLRADIASGKFRPAEGQSASEFIDEYISTRTQGLSPAYADAYKSGLAPQLEEAFVVRAETVAGEAKRDAVSRLSAAASRAVSADNMRQIVNEARQIDPDMTEDEAIAKTLIPAAEVAAINGDEAGFTRAMEVIGDRFPVEAAQLRVRLDGAIERRQNDIDRLFREDFDNMLLEGTPIGVIRQSVKDFDGMVSPSTLQNKMDELDRREAESIRQTMAMQRQAWEESTKQAIVANALDSVAAGRLVQSFDMELPGPDGKPFKIDNDEIAELARQQAWQSIEARIRQPNDQLAAKLDWLSRYPAAQDPNMKQAFAGVSRRIAVNAGEANVPPVAVEAFNFWRQASAMNPGVTNAHMSSEDLEFFRWADTIVTNTNQTPLDAMRTVALAMNSGQSFARFREQISVGYIRKQATDVTDAMNGTFAETVIRERAALYTMTGTPESKAVEDAITTFKADHVLINGVWANKQNRAAVDTLANPQKSGQVTLDEISDIIVDDHLATPTDDNAGLQRDDLMVVPVKNGWVIAEKINGAPVPNSPLFSDNDMLNLHGAISGELDYEKEIKRFETAITKRVRHNNPSTLEMFFVNNENRTALRGRFQRNLPPFTQAELAERPLPRPQRKPVDLPPTLKRLFDKARDNKAPKPVDRQAQAQAIENLRRNPVPGSRGPGT